MTHSEAQIEAARLAPKYPITITDKDGYFLAVPDDFPEFRSAAGTAEDARSLAFHSVMTMLTCRIEGGREIPPVKP